MGLAHPHPDLRSLFGVEAGARGVDQAHVVGLGLVFPREGEQDPEPLVGHALGAVARYRMRDLVAHHHGQAVRVRRDREDAGVDGHLASRQAEGVRLVRGDEVELPLEAGIFRDGGEPLADLAHHVDGRHDVLLSQDLPIRLQTERSVLLLVDIDELPPTGRWHALLVADPSPRERAWARG